MRVSALRLKSLVLLGRWGWLLGCVLLSSIFIVSGATKLFAPQPTADTAAAVGLPSSISIVLLVGAFEIVVSSALAIGYRRSWAALFLLAFVFFVTPAFHGFWRFGGPER